VCVRYVCGVQRVVAKLYITFAAEHSTYHLKKNNANEGLTPDATVLQGKATNNNCSLMPHRSSSMNTNQPTQFSGECKVLVVLGPRAHSLSSFFQSTERADVADTSVPIDRYTHTNCCFVASNKHQSRLVLLRFLFCFLLQMALVFAFRFLVVDTAKKRNDAERGV
jgi:hypothetical protein